MMNRFARVAVTVAVLCGKTSADTLCGQGETGCDPGCFLNAKNQLCERAPAGYFSPLGDTELYECRVGHFSRGHAENCTPCPAGSFVDTKGSDTCYLCGIATFSSEIGSKKCQSCNPALYVGYGSNAAETHVSGITFCIAPPKIGSPTSVPSAEPSNQPSVPQPPTLYPSAIWSGVPTAPLYTSMSPTGMSNVDPNAVAPSPVPTLPVAPSPVPTLLPTTLTEEPSVSTSRSEEPSASPSLSLEPTGATTISMEPTMTRPSSNYSVTIVPTPAVSTSSLKPSRSPVSATTQEPSTFDPAATIPIGGPSTMTPTTAPIIQDEDDDGSTVPLMQKLLWMVALPMFVLSILLCCCVWILLRCCGSTHKHKNVPEDGGALMLDEVSEIEDSEVYLENDTQTIDGMSEVEADEGGSVEVWTSY